MTPSALTKPELAALTRFKTANGPRWKFELSNCWATGNYNGLQLTDMTLLTTIRNKYGPSELDNFSF